MQCNTNTGSIICIIIFFVISFLPFSFELGLRYLQCQYYLGSYFIKSYLQFAIWLKTIILSRNLNMVQNTNSMLASMKPIKLKTRDKIHVSVNIAQCKMDFSINMHAHAQIAFHLYTKPTYMNKVDDYIHFQVLAQCVCLW